MLPWEQQQRASEAVACVTMKMPTVLTSKCCRNSATGWWAAGPGKLMPALLTRPARVRFPSALRTCKLGQWSFARCTWQPNPAAGAACLLDSCSNCLFISDVKQQGYEAAAELLLQSGCVCSLAHAAEDGEALTRKDLGSTVADARAAASDQHCLLICRHRAGFSFSAALNTARQAPAAARRSLELEASCASYLRNGTTYWNKWHVRALVKCARSLSVVDLACINPVGCL